MEKQRFTICPADQLPPGTKRIVEVGGRSIGVYNSAGRLYAVQNLCPHALAPICLANPSGTNLPSAPGVFEYGMEGLVLRCPWHGWEYDMRTGEALFGTDRRRLATFPVAVEDGQVVVSMRPRSAAGADATA
jgi:3-phenylpropionate/trans-cinnamate dioxygenase ferredoxin subunit